MNRRFLITTIFCLLCIILSHEDCLSWGTNTHKILSQYAAENSILNQKDFLKGLGFDNGLKHDLKWNDEIKPIIEWIRYGSEREDDYKIWEYIPLPFWDVRSDNHFHKATVQKENWGKAGLRDIRTGESSILWAQDFYGTQSRYTEGNWSWQKTRDCYYKALTALSDDDWQENFAMTFKGLGHQMHIIQDSAVPAHSSTYRL